jgi:DNA-binding GntR family transcriptional regulator
MLGSSVSLRPLVPTSRSAEVVDLVKEAILRGDLPPGSQLVERDLADRLGVSKTPIREALKLLSTGGLVVTHPYRGATVRPVDRAWARSVMEVRLLLEPAAVARAVPAHDVASVAAAREELGAAGRAIADTDKPALSLANRRFHQRLYAPCDNPLLRSLLDDLQDQAALVSVQGWRVRPTWTAEVAEHEAILAAVEVGDAACAKARLQRHIAGFLAVLEEVPALD